MCHHRGSGVGQNEATEPWDTSNTHTSVASLCEAGSLFLNLIKKFDFILHKMRLT